MWTAQRSGRPHSVPSRRCPLEDLAARVARQRLGPQRDVLRHLEVREALAPGTPASARPRTAAPAAARSPRRPSRPARRPARPTTAASATPGAPASAFSTSTQYTFSPPRLIMSLARSTTRTRPSSTRARSPVCSHPSTNVGRRRVRLVPVAVDDVGPAHQELADAVDGLVQREVDDRRGEAHGVGVLGRPLVGEERGDGGGLGEAEAVADPRVRERLLDAADERGRDRRAAVGDPADGREVVRGEVGLGQRERVDRGHAREQVDALVGGRAQERRGRRRRAAPPSCRAARPAGAAGCCSPSRGTAAPTRGCGWPGPLVRSMSITRIAVSTFERKFSWLVIAPFGKPVVPLV